MLLYQTEPFDDPDYIFELKLDGIRCIAYLGKDVVLQNKRYKDVTSLYPELSEINRCVKKNTILDGELVSLTGGKPDFFALQRRSLMADPFHISLAAKRNPVQFAAYDILYYDGKRLTDLKLTERKAILSKNVREGNGLSISRYIEKDGKAFFALAKERELEGIVAKKKDGKYHIGRRTRDWLKIKVMQDEDLLICGYLPDEAGGVGDLILGDYDDAGKLRLRGKVSLGISRSERTAVAAFAEKNPARDPHFGYPDAIWMKPCLTGTVQYMQKTEKGGMRQPVWKGLRSD